MSDASDPLRRVRSGLRSGVAAVRRRPVLLATPVVLLPVLLGFALSAWWTCGYAGCPDPGTLSVYQPEGASLLLDRDGEPLAELAPMPSEVIDLDDVPMLVREAFLAVEDRRFREHDGVDWLRIGGAALANLRAGGLAEGGSTITMQLARNMFSERIPATERTVRRKILEMRVARAIEERFEKEEILELYLNHIYFGGGTHGIEAASRHYFGHGAARLAVPEMALLAALPKAPAHYDPREHPQAARERRNLVLRLMVEQGRLGEQEAKAAADAPLGVTPSPPPPRESRPGAAPYFAEAVRRRLEERFGPSIYSEPVRVWTTLDRRAQRAAEEALARRLRAAERGALGPFPGAGGEPLQGAAVLLDSRTGDVLAWVGGREFETSAFDRVSHARRQPGSAFKPFVLAAALAEGHPLSTVLDDTPLTVELSGERTWSPKNFGDEYDGRVTAREALVRSKNVATVRLAQEVGTGDVAGMAERVGIEPPISKEPSMALGTVDVSPLELARAYSAFAGLGERVEPRLILRVSRPDGEVLWESEPESERVLDPAIAYLVNDVLTDAVRRGTGRGALSAGLRGAVAGKTGTSDDNTDAWFAGYTPRHVGVVWIGFDQPRTIGPRATGGRLAAPVWGRMAAAAERGEPVAAWPRPEGVVERRVDPATGVPLREGCAPRGRRPVRELFLAGEMPEPRCPGEDEDERGLVAAWLERREARDEARRAAEERERREEERLAELEAAELEAAEDEAARARLDRSPQARGEPVPRHSEPGDLAGWWELETHVRSSAVERYEGLRLGFRVHLRQDGDRLTGHGEKIQENGQPLPGPRRTPIDLEGRVDGREVTLRFTERGARRASAGTLVLTLTPDRSTMTGSFRSGAASTRGGARMLRSLR